MKFTDDEVAHYLLFDLSVNSGFRNYRRCVQEVHDPNNYFEVLQWRRKFYRDIVKADATQKVFLKGWIGRLCDIADHFKVQP